MPSAKFTVRLPNGSFLTDKKGNKVEVETHTANAIVHNIKKALAEHSTATKGFIEAISYKAGKKLVTIGTSVDKATGKDGRDAFKIKYDETIDLDKIDGKEVKIHVRGNGQRAVSDSGGNRRLPADAEDSLVGAIKQVVAASARPGNSPSPVIVINAPSGGDWVDVVKRRAKSSAQQLQPKPKPDVVDAIKSASVTLFEKLKDTVPTNGLHGKPSDEVLKRIIERNDLDESAIARDVSKWWEGELELEPWANTKKSKQRGPKPQGGAKPQQQAAKPPNPSAAALPDIVKAVLARVLASKSPDKDDVAALIATQKLLDVPETRRAILYCKNGWLISRADPYDRNLCWLVAPVQGAMGTTLSLKEALAFLNKGIRPLAKHLLENYDAANLYNLFFERREDGLVEAQVPEFSPTGVHGGPAFLRAEIEKISKSNGELGGNVHLILVATLLQAEIHVHKSDLGDGDSTMATSLRDEHVMVYRPLGMSLGQTKRVTHIEYKRTNTHFDSISGASHPFMSDAADRDPAKLLETAIVYISNLAETNSPEALQSRFGDDYGARDRHPISRGRGVIDLSIDKPAHGRSQMSTLTESVQTTNTNVAALAEQVKQIMLLLSAGAGRGPDGSGFGGPGYGGSGPGSTGFGFYGSGSGGTGTGDSGSGGSGSRSDGSGGSGPDGSGSGTGTGGSGTGTGTGGSSSGGSGTGTGTGTGTGNARSAVDHRYLDILVTDDPGT